MHISPFFDSLIHILHLDTTVALLPLGYSTGMGYTAGYGSTGMAGTGTVSTCATRGHTVPVSAVYGYVHGLSHYLQLFKFSAVDSPPTTILIFRRSLQSFLAPPLPRTILLGTIFPLWTFLQLEANM
jgi:hypothetical protein